jgi:hypothetical protein
VSARHSQPYRCPSAAYDGKAKVYLWEQGADPLSLRWIVRTEGIRIYCLVDGVCEEKGGDEVIYGNKAYAPGFAEGVDTTRESRIYRRTGSMCEERGGDRALCAMFGKKLIDFFYQF